jgi:hypothetical protein
MTKAHLNVREICKFLDYSCFNKIITYFQQIMQNSQNKTEQEKEVQRKGTF